MIRVVYYGVLLGLAFALMALSWAAMASAH